MTELLAEESAIGARPVASVRMSGSSIVLAAVVTALWGTNPAALKVAMRALPPLGCSGLRFVIAAVGVWAWCRFRRVAALPQSGEGRWLATNALLFVVQIATFTLGYSHPIEVLLPDGVDLRVDKQTHLVLSGYDKQMIGQVAANIRALRKPDPYKNKGVRYTGEALKKKVGKSGATGGKK